MATQEKTIPIHKERWLYLALGTLAMLCMGTLYAWSILKMPLAKTFGWTPGQLALNYSLAFCFFCLGNMLGSYLVRRMGTSKVVLIGGILIGLGYLLMANLQSALVVWLYLLFGGLIGGGTGMAYPALLAWVSAWFPDKRGTCSGILLMGFGFSALVLGNLLAWMFLQPSIGWRITYTMLGICTASVLILCAFIFRKPLPEQPRMDPTVAEKDESNGGEYTPMQVIRRASFWQFYLYGVLIAGLGSVVFSFAFDYCLSLGASAAGAASLVGVLSAANGSSRILFGLLYDKKGRRFIMFVGSLINVAAAGLLLLSVVTHSLPLGAIGLFVTGVAYGYGPVISSTLVQTFYGTHNFASNYSLNNTKVIVTSFYSPVAAALLTQTGTFAAPFLMVLVLSAAGFLIHFTIRRA